MRILMVHNYYQHRGGEDESTQQEINILRDCGHEVLFYSRHNDEIKDYNLFEKLALSQKTIWSISSYNDILAKIEKFKPDVAHFQNTFPLISPAAYYACKKKGTPVVQTLRNYRLLCPKGTFYRDNKICEVCAKKSIPWPSVLYGCYRDSKIASSSVAAMLFFHRLLKTWKKKVDLYITLTQFSRDIFVKYGIPVEKIVVKPNFIYPDPGIKTKEEDLDVLFVGRLSPEKGLNTLLDAWNVINTDLHLNIIGTGSMASQVTYIANNKSNINFLGVRSLQEVYQFIKKSKFLIFPSEWYETFGRVAIEAFACGVPVIASDLGGIAEIVEHKRTGLLFNAGSPDDLAKKIVWAIEHPFEMTKMGYNARKEYETKYTAEHNYQMLINIYKRVQSKR